MTPTLRGDTSRFFEQLQTYFNQIRVHESTPSVEIKAHGRAKAKPLIMLRNPAGHTTALSLRQNDNHSIGVVNYCYSMGWVDKAVEVGTKTSLLSSPVLIA